MMEMMQPDPMGWKVTKQGREEDGYILTFPEMHVIDGSMKAFVMVLWGEAAAMSVENVEDLKPKTKQAEDNVLTLAGATRDDTLN